MPIDSGHLQFDDTFQGMLKSRRQKLGLTHDQLSRLTKEIDPKGVGVSRVALSRYENGALPGLRELRILSFSLRVPLSDLVYGDPTDPMSDYELELELRISESVMGMVRAEGLIKEKSTQRPAKSQDFLALLEKVKAES